MMSALGRKLTLAFVEAAEVTSEGTMRSQSKSTL